jgi:hypothetical protein
LSSSSLSLMLVLLLLPPLLILGPNICSTLGRASLPPPAPGPAAPAAALAALPALARVVVHAEMRIGPTVLPPTECSRSAFCSTAKCGGRPRTPPPPPPPRAPRAVECCTCDTVSRKAPAQSRVCVPSPAPVNAERAAPGFAPAPLALQDVLLLGLLLLLLLLLVPVPAWPPPAAGMTWRC